MAEQEETFTEITPGLEAADPNKLVPLAEKGDPRAMNNLGLLWARGVGVPAPDFQEALRWWKGAAKRGYPLAMNNIGLLYANGQGVKQDYKEAFKWWEMSSEQGNAWAMNSIGDLYENGQGVERSYTEAMDWYRRAAEAGDGLAMYNIGALYENGRGVAPNFKAAMDWYERSADKGIPTAMLSLGKLLSEGQRRTCRPGRSACLVQRRRRLFHGRGQGRSQRKRPAAVRADANPLGETDGAGSGDRAQPAGSHRRAPQGKALEGRARRVRDLSRAEIRKR